MNKFIITSILLLCNIFLLSAQKPILLKQNHIVNRTIKLLKKDKALRNAQFSFYAIDINSGETVAAHNHEMSLMPASTMKIISSATALEILGPKYRFKTTIEYDGTIDTVKKILYGNIYIKGSGDPSLGSKYFSSTSKKQFLNNWVDAIKKANIDSVDGYIIGDAQLYSEDMTPGTWAYEDVANYYGAGACGLTIYDNSYTIHFRSNKNNGGRTKITKIQPHIPNILFDNKVRASNKRYDNAYIFGTQYSNNRTIKGTIPKARSDFRIRGSIPNPSYFAAYELKKHLKKANIRTKYIATSIRQLKRNKIYTKKKRKILYTTLSPTYSEIMYKTNQKSINLFAEHFLNHVGLARYSMAQTDSGAKAIEQFWQKKGLDTEGFYLFDGSGLSRSNGVAAVHLVFILKYMKLKSRYFNDFYKSLPIAGKTGTLRSLCKGTVAQGNLRAKSGSIRRVRAYAGYVKTRSGRKLAFSMNISNYTCSSRSARKKLQSLMVAMAKLNI